MAVDSNSNMLIINTGNILSLNDITKKTAQNPTEELNEAIITTVKKYKTWHTINSHLDATEHIIHRPDDDLIAKIKDHDVADLKIGLKLFLTDDDTTSVKRAIEEAFNTLKISQIHNVIISFNHKISSSDDMVALKSIWLILEEMVKREEIQQLGIADIEEAAFKIICDWAKIKPKIVQINLAACCIVPPSLQIFCKDNDVQLLTHSDSCEILPPKDIKQTFGEMFLLNWVVRYLVHIKCRGVLITKGYLLCLRKE